MTSSYRIAAKPTLYNGTRFRSRLEARWAAFFDLAGWQWEYEPVDTTGWVPDFYLHAVGGPLPVEIKPIEWTGTTRKEWDLALSRDDLNKVKINGLAEVLVLGSYLPKYAENERGGDRAIGAIIGEFGNDYALIGEGVDTKFDIEPLLGIWGYKFNQDGRKINLQNWGAVDLAWREAGNLVQWLRL